jgi:hypothetical protein
VWQGLACAEVGAQIALRPAFDFQAIAQYAVFLLLAAIIHFDGAALDCVFDVVDDVGSSTQWCLFGML